MLKVGEGEEPTHRLENHALGNLEDLRNRVAYDLKFCLPRRAIDTDR